MTGEKNGRGQQAVEEHNSNSLCPGERNGDSFMHVVVNYVSVYENSIEFNFRGVVVRGRLCPQKLFVMIQKQSIFDAEPLLVYYICVDMSVL